MPGVRFRDFLFLVTLASVTAATIALHRRVGNYEAFQAHDRRVMQARLHAKYMMERIAWTEEQVKAASTLADQQYWQTSLDANRSRLKKDTDPERHERLARFYAP